MLFKNIDISVIMKNYYNVKIQIQLNNAKKILGNKFLKSNNIDSNAKAEATKCSDKSVI